MALLDVKEQMPWNKKNTFSISMLLSFYQHVSGYRLFGPGKHFDNCFLFSAPDKSTILLIAGK